MRHMLGLIAAVAGWLLLMIAVLAHATLAMLAGEELVRMGWPLPTWFDTGAVMLVLASAAAGLAAWVQVTVRAAAGARALRTLIRTGRRLVPPSIQREATVLGCATRLDAVAAEQAFAVTYGLIRPRILVSTSLATVLTPAEIGAVLAHEHEHMRRWDPLRMLGARLFAAWGCYLPAARWLAGRAVLRRELAADRSAVRRAGRDVLAGARLKLTGTPACPAVAAASPAGAEPRSLEARVTQLEGGRPPRHRPPASRLLASGGTLALLVPASLCCAALSQILPGGML